MIYIYIKLLIICIALSSQAHSQDVQFRFDKKFDIETDGSPLLGEISDVVFDNQGFFYLLDNGNKQIHKFGTDGEFVQSFGREGRGPGEFTRASNSIVYDEEKSNVYILDYPNARIVGYNTVTAEHTTINLQSTSAIPINKLTFFNGDLMLLGSHQNENNMIHLLDAEGETTDSFGDFINFDNFMYNSNGKQQLSQVFASSHNEKLLVTLAAPNRVKIYDKNLKLVREFEDELLPIPWETHMTMEPGRYSSTFYSMSSNNQIMSDDLYLFQWTEIVDPEGPISINYLELRDLRNGDLIYQENMDDLFVIDLHRVSENRALIFTRDSQYKFSVYELTIDI